MPENRTPDGKFLPGTTPNPGGRPKAIREALEAFRNPEDLKKARDRLRELFDHEDGKVAVMAIKEWNDRALGKAPQAITGQDGEPIKVNIADVLDKFRKLGE
jgi:hypothetical protein